MKRFIAAALLSLGMAGTALATEAALVRTYQPFAWDGIAIEKVTCYAWTAQSRVGDALRFISAPNVPPNFSKQPEEDMNLASISHLHFDNERGPGMPLTLFMKADEFSAPKDYSREEVVKACLECVRRVLPPEMLKTPLTFSASAENRGWMGKIVDEFNAHDRSTVFYAGVE
jgi:hypothetical protein